MGKKKKKKKPGEGYFEYTYGTGKIGKMMDRYGVGGMHSGHPDGRSGRANRSQEQVNRDIAAAMNADYDTRRTMEAAGLAGHKGAKKFSKKGFNEDNIFDAYELSQELQDKYGGSDKKPARTTFGAVKQDRDKLNARIDAAAAAAKAASNKAPAAEPMKDVVLSDKAKAINNQVSQWESGSGYERSESPFASASKSAYTHDALKDPTQETEEAAKPSTAPNANGEPRDNQDGAQNFFQSYKDSLKAVLFDPDKNKEED